ncbi:putative microsomal epoxide hydrolase [Microsporum canis]|uniref:Epoxide hydrolase n=1 Tax=Arthroderma otae (strain ATCC MYA-4605 / CBS 113480) TaxID=554155 RepID=C5FVD5_ARTOC|nr:epoxide hydrolase [Microsporum canis CBS 113480]EEQ33869.1 epoxide hydrolase [Microsporum canis CBS 113480]
MAALPPLPLPDGVSSRQLDTAPRGISFHVLEAGYSPGHDRPLILLLHGFPELAFSWRKMMPLLAAAGYYVVAPDQRGFGRTTGWDTRDFDNVDLRDFEVTNLVRDMVVLVHALGYKSVECVVGHDFGAVVAGYCALARPDFFKRAAFMNHPFVGAPDLSSSRGGGEEDTIHRDLAALNRKHYKWYYSTRQASSDMNRPAQGLHAFLRGYFYLKSATWLLNKPVELQAWTASELAKMPDYYVMPLYASMPEAVAFNVALETPLPVQESCAWLSDAELSVYVDEFSRTGFQGGLNWYRVATSSAPDFKRDLDLFAGRKIDCPCLYIGGAKDWGTYQVPGAIEKLANSVCDDFCEVIVDDAGHWLAQEKPQEVVDALAAFIHWQ